MTQSQWNIDAKTVGPFSTNHYLLHNKGTGNGWLFDAGFDAATLIDWVDRSGCKLQGIYITHGHIDHVGVVTDVARHFSVPWYMHGDDIPLTRNLAIQGQMFGVRVNNPPDPDEVLVSGPLALDNLALEIRHTPGHSPGGVCFYSATLATVIAGDSLFQGSIGRTDLPGGSYAQLMESIQNQLLSLPDETTVLAGHMGRTTIGTERATNPFLS